MAGSYKHVVNKRGAFAGTRHLDHLGDAHEALEEMYGMIWFLANGDPEAVERARQEYTKGIALSPGSKARTRREPSKHDSIFKRDSDWAREAVSLLRKLSADAEAEGFVAAYDDQHQQAPR